MPLAKVITLKTRPNRQGHWIQMVATIDADVSPNEFFDSMDLLGQVESYVLSENMPLPYALAHSACLKKALHITD